MRPLLLTLLIAATLPAQHPVDWYNVVWDSPSKNSEGSMPTGNGDIGLNVWVEENGDLLFYVSKTDAWSETVRLLKLGRVRVRISPNPFAAGQPFQQTLQLRSGEIRIRAGKPEEEARIGIWVDANYPVIRVEVETIRPSEMQVVYERWRDQQRVLEGAEAQSAEGLQGGPEPLISYGDAIHLEGDDSVIWFHRNAKSAYPSIMKLQGLGDALTVLPDPLLHRTFGAAMKGDNFTRMNPTSLRSKSASQKHEISIYALTAIADNSDDWVRGMHTLIGRTAATTAADRKAAHDKWWRDFWDRSYIRVTGGEIQQKVSQGYALQRFLNACAGRGEFPIKPNGSIFTTDARIGDMIFDADFRKGGGLYSFRDTRLIYWPMLASGDYDLMMPFLRMYVDARVLAQRRTDLYFKHQGIYFPETMYFWGSYANNSYGWNRESKPLSFIESSHLRDHFSNSLELLAMLLEYSRYREDKQFVRTSIALMAEGIIDFYDGHYERDANGKLRIAPLPDIAGLKYVLNSVLTDKIPISKQAANTARKLLQQLPDVPTTERVTYLEPGKQARDVVAKNFSAANPNMRFPAFWESGSNWAPDQAHGGVAMMALQAMLVQANDDKILVAPAWPSDWDVEFKLHAPGGTVVEGAIRDGKIERLKTTPDKRLADVRRFEPQ